MSDKTNTVWVELTDDNHTHKGRPCKRGERIEVRDDQAERLIKRGRAKPAQKPAKPE